MTRVERREDEPFESLLRRSRKRVAESRIVSTVKRKRCHIPKSEQRRLARRRAIRGHRQPQRREKRVVGTI